MKLLGQIFWQIVYFAFLAAVLGVPIMMCRAALRRVRTGRMGRLKAFVLCGLAAISPTALYVGIFFALVGIEELTRAALIPEEIGRSFLIVVGFGLLVWLLVLIPFAVLIARARKSEWG